MFERRRKRNIAMYASREKLATRGRFYNEDDLAPFDVLDYDLDVTALPDRQWVEGRAKMRVRVRAPSLGQLTIRLRPRVRPVGRQRQVRAHVQPPRRTRTPSSSTFPIMAEGAELTLTVTWGGSRRNRQIGKRRWWGRTTD